jgi:RHS repeat-associated protein
MGYLNAPDAMGPKYTGKYRDQESTLDWFEVRHMSGAQGRFQSVDPGNAGASIGDPQTWNAYAYVGNNPLSYTDPGGNGVRRYFP